MNIEWLQTFVETVRTSSITKAATNLHLTQPAVSMQLQNLERALDSELLIRSNKGVQMTDAGRVLFSYAQSFITLADNLRQDLDNLKNDTREVLSIGTCSPIGQYALPCALYMFKQKYPQVGVRVQNMTTAEVVERLRDHSIDLGFIEGGIDKPGLHEKVILQSDLVAIVPPDEGDGVQSAGAKDLAATPLILATDHCALGSLADLSMTMQPAIEMDGLEAVKSAVASGHGFSVVPYFTVKKELYSGMLKKADVAGLDQQCTYSAVWRQAETSSPALDYFIHFLQENGHEVFC
ncbi:MAG TPA: hypothetical protein DCX37_04440 [Firmicutes bacterium]|nr:hypothetical protein [Bacillota bacterium]HBL50027.1 hypothetical protein [Bacillota bacterium]